jgi:hypothetical protein
MEKFLKRFQRLENTTLNDNFIPDGGLKPSKRFTKLEVNEKKIEFVLEDKVDPIETVPQGKEFFFLCPYCGGQNSSNVEICRYCKRQLKNQYIPDYSGKAGQLKKCHCGALNLKERKNCWVCGRDFSLWGDEEVKESPENVITLNIDGQVYKSTDPDLPEGIVALMEKIRREGYSEEIIHEWVQGRNESIDQAKTRMDSRLTQIRWGLFWRILGLIAFIIFIFFQFRVFFH